MARIIQCVPNFSEGRDKGIIEKIVEEIRIVDEVKLLNYSMDKMTIIQLLHLLGSQKRLLRQHLMHLK